MEGRIGAHWILISPKQKKSNKEAKIVSRLTSLHFCKELNALESVFSPFFFHFIFEVARMAVS